MDGILLFEYVRSPGTSFPLPFPLIGSYWCSLNPFRLNMALELAKHNPVYEDIASKFFEVCLFPLLVGLDAHRCLIMAPRSSSVFFRFRLDSQRPAFYFHRRCNDIQTRRSWNQPLERTRRNVLWCDRLWERNIYAATCEKFGWIDTSVCDIGTRAGCNQPVPRIQEKDGMVPQQ